MAMFYALGHKSYSHNSSVCALTFMAMRYVYIWEETWPVGWQTHSGLQKMVLESPHSWANWLVCHPTSRTFGIKVPRFPLDPKDPQEKFGFKLPSVQLYLSQDASMSLSPGWTSCGADRLRAFFWHEINKHTRNKLWNAVSTVTFSF